MLRVIEERQLLKWNYNFEHYKWSITEFIDFIQLNNVR